MIKRIEPTNLNNIKRKFRELLYADVHPDKRNDFFYELVYYFQLVHDYFIFINSTYNLSIFVSANIKSAVNLKKNELQKLL